MSCVSACGKSPFYRDGHAGQCLGGGGWVLGHLMEGTQIEHVRLPYADNSSYLAPQAISDEELLTLADARWKPPRC